MTYEISPLVDGFLQFFMPFALVQYSTYTSQNKLHLPHYLSYQSAPASSAAGIFKMTSSASASAPAGIFSFTSGIASLEENRRETPKPELVDRLLADNIREVSYSVKKHKGGHNSVPGFEMDCPMGKEDCSKNGIYRWQKSTGLNNPFKHLLTCEDL
jgi:hypothetical protein